MQFSCGPFDEPGAGEWLGCRGQMPDLVPGVVSLTQQGDCPGRVRNIGKGMADTGVDQPLCPFASEQALENEEIGNAGLIGSGAVEVGGAGDGCNNVAFPD